ncbi:DUF4133 domain-containing protein [Arenibacter sp. 6A1]|uniref:DUF4133 domain-containing protein n=1 Tax=Arenibacter sp. 6A1 TaxID=2720391 RepID=UPI001447018D|nr:DUF4133 domain-containing protein [Arenibacter sp. 6A1]
MCNSHIPIRKGLQKEASYWGLKAKYIYYFVYLSIAAIVHGLVLSLFLPAFLAMLISAALMGIAFLIILFYSRTYGANGFIKKMADTSKPSTIKLTHNFKSLLLWQGK